MGGKKAKYVTVSLPIAISQAIDSLIEQLGYWPSRGAFVREACLVKIREERRRLREIRASRSERGEEPRRGTNPGISPRESREVTNPQGDDSSPKRKGG